MRKIKVNRWTETRTKDNGETELKDMDTLQLLRVMILNVHPSKLPTGVEAFGLMKDFHTSLTKAKSKPVLILEDATFKWIEKNVIPNVPAGWGLTPDIAGAVDEIIGAEEYNLNEDQEDTEEDTAS